MDESKSFYIFNRQEWKEMQTIPFDVQVTAEDIERFISINDVLTFSDIEEVYLPILQILGIYIRHYQERIQELGVKFKQNQKKVPYIIGVSGSVAVGKSTFCRLLKELLSQVYRDKKVQLITTDGFLYPNAILEEKGLEGRKGFPESYDMPALINFLSRVKNGEAYQQAIQVPKYSHRTYNILQDEYYEIDQADILIVEGINVLQLQGNEFIFASDFFDFSFYVDAEEKNIERWYLERFEILLDLAADHPEDYYHTLSQGDRVAALKNARHIWETINLTNLHQYILPTRSRAELILHKNHNQYIDKIMMNKI